MPTPLVAKHRLVLGTAGHIDHGKTSLVKALTGVDTDRLPEEKARSISIDLGFAPLELDRWSLGVVDVPGHERFIKNMLAGATGVDLALLVVAVDDSVMPQTIEHLEILEHLRLSAGVIALTKCDLADASWIDLVADDVRKLVASTFLAQAPLVRVSALSGAGLEDLRVAISAVAEQVMCARQSVADGPFRLAVDRVFTISGSGTVVTGCVASGQARVGEELELMPRGAVVRIRGLQNHGRAVEVVERGMRAALNLAGIRYDELARGDSLATPRTIRPTRRATVEIHISDRATRPLKQREKVRLHVGSSEIGTTVQLLELAAVDPGCKAFAQLRFSDETALVWGQPFVLRSVSPVATIGGGRVLATRAPILRRINEAVRQELVDLASNSPERRLAAAARLAGVQPWSAADAFAMAGVAPQSGVVERLLDNGTLATLVTKNGAQRLVHEHILHDEEDRLLRILDEEHRGSPLRPAVERSRLVSRWSRQDGEFFDALVGRLATQRRVALSAQGIALADWRPALSAAQTRAFDWITDVYRQSGVRPPGAAELSQLASVAAARGLLPPSAAAEMTRPAAATQGLIDLAVARQQLVRIADGLYFHVAALDKVKDCLRERLGDGLTVGEIRELIDTSRKTAVPLCEYLDAIGFTHRVGDVRRLASPSSS